MISVRRRYVHEDAVALAEEVAVQPHDLCVLGDVEDEVHDVLLDLLALFRADDRPLGLRSRAGTFTFFSTASRQKNLVCQFWLNRSTASHCTQKLGSSSTASNRLFAS